jgi:prostaglandin-endoperoxide synthase 2
MPDVKPPPLPQTVKQPGAVERFIEDLPMKGAPFWQLLQRIDPIQTAVNRILINRAINVLAPRPYRLSTRLPYTTHETLTDKRYNSRQVQPSTSEPRTEPPVDEVVALFKRERFIPCEKSTVLFSYVAQWFTDGFLRSNRKDGTDAPRDITKNESTHEVDLAQLYGLDEAELAMLRDHDNPILLASQGPPGEELAPDLYRPDGSRVEQFAGLRVITPRKLEIDHGELLAMGSDAANIQIGYAMLNTLFLREHNRIAREIEAANPGWDPDRIFGAARSVLTVLLIRVVIEEYINHIHPYKFSFRLDPKGFRKQPWMRPNWVAVEFNLLYRWHCMIPDALDVGGDEAVPILDTTYKAKTLLSQPGGLATLVDRASRQRAGRVGLHNTSDFLLDRAERPGIQAGRTVNLRGYNDYREACKLGRVQHFDQVTSNPALAAELAQVYGGVDEIEFFPGLFAEDPRPNSVLPPLIGRLVGLHAFSQLMTNPLFAPEIYNTETFSRRGAEIIDETKSLADIVRRNIPRGSPMPAVRLTRAEWRPV